MVALTLVVGAIGAFTLAAAAGARRTSSSLTRFKVDSASADIELDGEASAAQLAQLSRVPGVAAIGTFRAFGLVIPAAPDFQQIGAPTDGRFGVAIDRGRIVAGRRPNPAAVDEVTVGEGLANRLHIRAGNALDVESYTPAQIAATLGGDPNAGAPAGPRVRLRVVGIERRPLDLGERNASGGFLLLTPAFDRAYRDRIGVFGVGIRVRTDRGVTDVPRVLAASRHIFGNSVFSATGLATESQGASDAINVLALALWIAASVAALAGTVAMAIVLGRELSFVSLDQESLPQLGCTRRQCVAMNLPSAAVIAIGGALVAALGAVALSPLYPLGVARRADPSVGYHADWTVLLLGIVGVGAAVLTIAVLAALRATRGRPAAAFRSRRARTSTLAERCAAAGIAPSATNGLRMAFEAGRDRSEVPVRSALVGALVGVLGVTSALVFASSLGRLASTPQRYGSTWDFSTADITTNAPCGAGVYGLTTGAGLASVSEVCTENVDVDGRPLTAVAFTNLRGSAIEPTIVTGRAPRTGDEIALGSKTLHALGKHVGDEVTVTGRSAKAIDYRITGQAVIPTLDAAVPLADGATFTGQGFRALFDPNLFNRYFVGRFTPDADRTAVERRVDAIPQLGPVSSPTVPVEVDRLRQVGWLPATLAVVLAALAFLALGHALVTGVRRRRREFAILKALGFSRGQVRATVASQATALGAVGLVVGIPVGVLVGDLVWRLVAGGLGVVTTPLVPTMPLLVTIACALLAVNVVAVFPARIAALTPAAAGLRSE